MTETLPETLPETPAPPARSKQPRALPVLEKLAALYPHLFGDMFLPLKRGIFQDLLAAHPDAFERETLKDALAFHTRSTRYLSSVAAGHQRHDLQGQAERNQQCGLPAQAGRGEEAHRPPAPAARPTPAC